MRRQALRTTVVMLVAAGLVVCGCATPPVARYVYQDGQFGVVGIPQNTNLGKDDFLKQAHALMAAHFPEGYEIVRAEEVVEGQRFLDAGKKTEFDTEPSVSALDQLIKLGKLSSSRSFEQKDQVPIVECRIIYKRKAPHEAPGRDGFTAVANIKPGLYLDPNEMTRTKSEQLIADCKKELKGDVSILKSAHRSPSSSSASSTTKK